MKESTKEYRVRSNTLLAWVEEHLEYAEGEEDPVGGKREETGTLYCTYKDYCEGAGNSPKSLQNFSADLVDLLTNSLGWKGIEKRKEVKGSTDRHRSRPRSTFISNVQLAEVAGH